MVTTKAIHSGMVRSRCEYEIAADKEVNDCAIKASNDFKARGVEYNELIGQAINLKAITSARLSLKNKEGKLVMLHTRARKLGRHKGSLGCAKSNPAECNQAKAVGQWKILGQVRTFFFSRAMMCFFMNVAAVKLCAQYYSFSSALLVTCVHLVYYSQMVRYQGSSVQAVADTRRS